MARAVGGDAIPSGTRSPSRPQPQAQPAGDPFAAPPPEASKALDPALVLQALRQHQKEMQEYFTVWMVQQEQTLDWLADHGTWRRHADGASAPSNRPSLLAPSVSSSSATPLATPSATPLAATLATPCGAATAMTLELAEVIPKLVKDASFEDKSQPNGHHPPSKMAALDSVPSEGSGPGGFPADLHKEVEAADALAPAATRVSRIRASGANVVTSCSSSSKKRRLTFAGGISVEEPESFMEWFVGSKPFHLFMTLVIIGNALAAGWEVEVISGQSSASLHEDLSHATDHSTIPPGFRVAQIIFSFTFVAEVALRMFVNRNNFRKDLGWNIFDMVVAAGSIVEVGFTLGKGDSLPVLVIVRIIRVARIVGLIHVIHAFRTARLIVLAIIHTLRQLAWCLVIIFIVLYIFAIVFTQATAQHLAALDAGEDHKSAELMYEFWGTVPRSAYTLLRCMIEGIHWGEPAHALMHLHWIYFTVFLVFILFTKLTMLEVMLGFFCEHAFAVTKADKEEIVLEQLRDKKKYFNEFRRIFAAVDDDGSGTVTYEELCEAIKDEELKAYFASLNIDVSKASDIFRLLDDDGSGFISPEEFVEGCMKLRGLATCVDVKTVSQDLKKLALTMQDFKLETQEELQRLAVASERRGLREHLQGVAAPFSWSGAFVSHPSTPGPLETVCVLGVPPGKAQGATSLTPQQRRTNVPFPIPSEGPLQALCCQRTSPSASSCSGDRRSEGKPTFAISL